MGKMSWLTLAIDVGCLIFSIWYIRRFHMRERWVTPFGDEVDFEGVSAYGFTAILLGAALALTAIDLLF